MKKRCTVLVLCLLMLLSGCRVTTPLPTEQTSPTQTSVTAPASTQTLPNQTDATQDTQPEETVDPDSLWLPICEEYINLRATPDGELIDTVKVNETVVLEKWEGKHALVTYKDKQGYVLSNNIKPENEYYLTDRLQVVAPTDTYTYDQMLTDISALQQLYPKKMTASHIGITELGRKIPVIRLGDPNAKHHVLMQGAMHGREHFTAWLLMALTDFALSMGYTDGVCYHIIPMSNPDGVCISQSGLLDAMQTKIYETDLMAGYTTADSVTYARQWKANAMGIDLNRNFESGWEVSLERADPSSEKHRGSKAFSAVESRALRDYTKAYPFNATISVHSHGSVIYYQYGNKQPVNDLSYSLALAAQAATGYTPLTYDGITGAGYKDWAMDALGIPSLTLEIGCYSTPLEQRDIYNTFARCEALFPALNKWLQENPNEVTS